MVAANLSGKSHVKLGHPPVVGRAQSPCNWRLIGLDQSTTGSRVSTQPRDILLMPNVLLLNPIVHS